MPLTLKLGDGSITKGVLSETEWKELINEVSKDGFQLFDCPFETYAKTINSSVENLDYLSAAVLTAIALEEDLNSHIRVACLVKGYNHNQISNFIRELGVKSKVELILPSDKSQLGIIDL